MPGPNHNCVTIFCDTSILDVSQNMMMDECNTESALGPTGENEYSAALFLGCNLLPTLTDD